MLHRLVFPLRTISPIAISKRLSKALDLQHLYQSLQRSQRSKRYFPASNHSTEQRKSESLSATLLAYRDLASIKAIYYSNHLVVAVKKERARRRRPPRMATTSGDDVDISKRTQQSPLAAQREKAQGLQPRKGGFFTLGYKEAVSQWVRCAP